MPRRLIFRIGNCLQPAPCPYEGVWKHAAAVFLEDLGHVDMPRPVLRSRKGVSDALDSYPERQSKAELIALVKDLARQNPEVHKVLQDCCHLSLGEIPVLVKSTGEEIEKLSAEPARVNPWKSEGNVPDYSGVRDRLEILLAKGYADKVISLGKNLLKRDKGFSLSQMRTDEHRI